MQNKRSRKRTSFRTITFQSHLVPHRANGREKRRYLLVIGLRTLLTIISHRQWQQFLRKILVSEMNVLHSSFPPFILHFYPSFFISTGGIWTFRSRLLNGPSWEGNWEIENESRTYFLHSSLRDFSSIVSHFRNRWKSSSKKRTMDGLDPFSSSLELLQLKFPSIWCWFQDSSHCFGKWQEGSRIVEIPSLQPFHDSLSFPGSVICLHHRNDTKLITGTCTWTILSLWSQSCPRVHSLVVVVTILSSCSQSCRRGQLETTQWSHSWSNPRFLSRLHLCLPAIHIQVKFLKYGMERSYSIIFGSEDVVRKRGESYWNLSHCLTGYFYRYFWRNR